MGTLFDRLADPHGLIGATSKWEYWEWDEFVYDFDPRRYNRGNLCRWPDCGRKVSNRAQYCMEHAPMMRATIQEFLKSAGTIRQWLNDLNLSRKNAPNCPVCGKKTVLWFVISDQPIPAWVCKRTWRDDDDELMRCRGRVGIDLD